MSLQCPKCSKGYAECKCPPQFSSQEERDAKLAKIRRIKEEQTARVPDIIRGHDIYREKKNIGVMLSATIVASLELLATRKGVSFNAAAHECLSTYGDSSKRWPREGAKTKVDLHVPVVYAKRYEERSEKTGETISSIIEERLAEGLAAVNDPK